MEFVIPILEPVFVIITLMDGTAQIRLAKITVPHLTMESVILKLGPAFAVKNLIF